MTPRASRSRIVGRHADALKIQLAAPPVDGAANAALVELIAETFDVPRRSVELISGATSKHKRLRIDGLSAAELEVKLRGEVSGG